jgi:hypothetical protein
MHKRLRHIEQILRKLEFCEKEAFVKICTLLGCYAASSGSSVSTFRGNLSVPS